MLITGATGSFGRAFVKRLLENGEHDRICIYSRDEYKQALMREDLNDDRLRFFVGDVRDQSRLRRAMEGVDVVVHAAALKRIETGHYNPGEMIKTNVLGSMNVVEASHDAKVKKVVFLSTDKAFQPISAYGQSKALAESLFLAADYASGKSGPRFAVTRYGNVAASTGSIIPKWREIIANDGRVVPVTAASCTRFWMLMDEAVDLVLNTIEDMDGGELNIPTLPAYSVGDLAKAMNVEMDIKGLPHFEKKHESMDDGNCSENARRMSVEELREALKSV